MKLINAYHNSVPMSFHLNRTINVESIYVYMFMPLGNVWLSLLLFSQNTQPFHELLRTSSAPNYNQVGRKTQKRVKI